MPSLTESTDGGTPSETLETERKSISTCGLEKKSSTKLKSSNPARTTPRTPQRSIRKSFSQRQGRHFLRRYHQWKSAHLYVGRYSIEKLLDFEQFQRVATPTRVVSVIALTPLPAFLTVVGLTAIPLQSPLLPATSQAAYFIQSWLSFSFLTFGMLLYMRCTLGLPKNVYSHREGALIAVLTAGANELLMLLIAVLWRFPIPFRGALGTPSYAVFFMFFHAVVLRKRLRYYRQKIRDYLPLYFTQVLIFVLFKVIALGFKNAPTWTQAAIACCFPLLRSLLKGVLRAVARPLQDISTEVTMCVVEVFGSLFQCVYLQCASSTGIGGVCVLMNFVYSALELIMFRDHEFVVDGKQATQTAFRIVESALFPGALVNNEGRKADQSFVAARSSHDGVSVAIQAPEAMERSSLSSRSKNSKKIACVDPLAAMALEVTTIELGYMDRDSAMRAKGLSMPLRRTIIDDVEIAHRHHAVLLSQTLHLLNASEVIVSAEYLDFACSFYFGFYVLATYHLPNSKFILPFIGLPEEEFWRSMLMLAVYAAIGSVLLLILFLLVQSKFGFSTFYQLAFVLEKYWMGVQGKIISCVTLIAILNTVHQGPDPSLQFDWEKILKGSTCR